MQKLVTKKSKGNIKDVLPVFCRRKRGAFPQEEALGK
jgi:hypothetical protein